MIFDAITISLSVMGFLIGLVVGYVIRDIYDPADKKLMEKEHGN